MKVETKQKLKTVLAVNLAIILSIWLICWLSLAFIEFKLSNPLQWIIDLPKETEETRGRYLMCIFSYLLVAFVFSSPVFISNESTKGSLRSDEIDMALNKDYLPSANRRQKTSCNRSSTSVTDIAVGVGTGMLGAEIIGDVFGIGD